MSNTLGIWKWSDRIAQVDVRAQISLGEGDTPLVRSRRIGKAVGIEHLYFKIETSNPSGSYKDRFAAVAVSDLLARGQRRCLATSSGNTGAALATYCAAAGIDCTIAILETTPRNKLAQMLAHGARLLRIRGFGVDPAITRSTLERLAHIGQAHDNPPQISAFRYSPVGMSGVQTIAYELADSFAHQGCELDHLFVPAGGGGLALAVALGFETLGPADHSAPRIHVVQPEGNNTIASPLRHGSETAQSVDCTTAISGLQVASVIDGDAVIRHCRASGGTGYAVSDEMIWETQRRLAREEGIFCEPAGAVALAGAIRAAKNGGIEPADTVVCLVTGSGFKDTASVERMNCDLNVPTIELDELETRLNG